MKIPLFFAISLLFRPLFFVLAFFFGFQIAEESIGFSAASIMLDLFILLNFIKFILVSKIKKHFVFGLFLIFFMLVLAFLNFLRLQFHHEILNYFVKYFLSI